jgi:hypothetical protein
MQMPDSASHRWIHWLETGTFGLRTTLESSNDVKRSTKPEIRSADHDVRYHRVECRRRHGVSPEPSSEAIDSLFMRHQISLLEDVAAATAGATDKQAAFKSSGGER